LRNPVSSLAPQNDELCRYIVTFIENIFLNYYNRAVSLNSNEKCNNQVITRTIKFQFSSNFYKNVAADSLSHIFLRSLKFNRLVELSEYFALAHLPRLLDRIGVTAGRRRSRQTPLH